MREARLQIASTTPCRVFVPHCVEPVICSLGGHTCTRPIGTETRSHLTV